MSDSKTQLFRGFSPEAMEARCRGHMFLRRVEIISDFLLDHLIGGVGSVLELGAGTGQMMSAVAKKFSSAQFIAVEPAAQYVSYAQGKYAIKDRLNYYQSTAEALPLAEKSISCAYSVNIWHHIDMDRLRDSASEVARVLKDDGRYLLIEPNVRHPYIFLYQGLMKDERHFIENRELAALKDFFIVEKKFFRFVFPEFIRAVPSWITSFERRLECCPFLTGAVIYILRKK